MILNTLNILRSNHSQVLYGCLNSGDKNDFIINANAYKVRLLFCYSLHFSTLLFSLFLSLFLSTLSFLFFPFDFSYFFSYPLFFFPILFSSSSSPTLISIKISSFSIQPPKESHDTMATCKSPHNSMFTLLPISIRSHVVVDTVTTGQAKV